MAQIVVRPQAVRLEREKSNITRTPWEQQLSKSIHAGTLAPAFVGSVPPLILETRSGRQQGPRKTIVSCAVREYETMRSVQRYMIRWTDSLRTRYAGKPCNIGEYLTGVSWSRSLLRVTHAAVACACRATYGLLMYR